MNLIERTYKKHPVIFVSVMVISAVAIMIPIAISERGSDIFADHNPPSNAKGKRFNGHGTIINAIGEDWHNDGSRETHYILKSSDGRTAEILLHQGKPRYDDRPTPVVNDRIFVQTFLDNVLWLIQ